MAKLNNRKSIQGVVELMPNIKDKIEETTNEYNNYLEVFKHEKFKEKKNEKDDDAIKRAESIFDRLDEMRRRNQIVLKNGKETMELIDVLKNKIESVVRNCGSDEFLLAKTNNELIDKIINVEERKTDKEIGTLQNQIDLIKQMFTNKRTEWISHKTNIEDISNKHQQEKRIRRMNDIIEINEMKQIEEWTGRKIGNVIFDSDINNWNVNTSVFDQRVLNKSNLIFIIEDDDGNKFGGFVNAKIDKYNTWINDSKSFVFSLKSNGRLNEMLKFDITDSEHAFALGKQTDEDLFVFGNNNDDDSDICIWKENDKNESYCDQSSFNYNGIENALCGKEIFTSTRITVIQMK